MRAVPVFIQPLKIAASPTPPIELKTLNGVVPKETPTTDTRYTQSLSYHPRGWSDSSARLFVSVPDAPIEIQPKQLSHIGDTQHDECDVCSTVQPRFEIAQLRPPLQLTE